jgi:hypothetical protein
MTLDTTMPGAERSPEGAAPPVLRKAKEPSEETERLVHVMRDGVVCDTERRGHPTPQGRSPTRIVVDASEGFVPLWAPDTILRWRFRERSIKAFEDSGATEAAIEQLLAEALLAWGDAAPVRFTKDNDVWDFEIVVRQGDECSLSGCVLASAFFPDAGRHELVIYPKMFTQSPQEQVETLIHEIGHIFGLRHFFAQISETAWASEVFGTHSPFSIMNYGANSVLTEADRSDLKRLYQLAWSGAIAHVNGTPIRFVRPYHTLGAPTGGVQISAVPAAAPGAA